MVRSFIPISITAVSNKTQTALAKTLKRFWSFLRINNLVFHNNLVIHKLNLRFLHPCLV